jgi:hypothetical protein
MAKFIFKRQFLDKETVTLEVNDIEHIDEVKAALESFLLACGYQPETVDILFGEGGINE